MIVEDAFVVFECVCCRSIEFGLEIWVASLDLRKAFDRVEYVTLFAALRSQNVPDAYLALLAQICSSQSGHLKGTRPF